MRLSKRAFDRLVVARALRVAGVLLLGACSQRYSPTEPFVPPATPSSPPVSWSGSWTFDQATPAGDCLTDALNAFHGGLSHWGIRLSVEQAAGSIQLHFFMGQGNLESEGFWPVEFTGTVGPDGAVVASVPTSLIGSLRTDPWLELCYWEWSMEGGQLSATLSPDGRRLTGTIVESFRPVPDGAPFTVRSHFEAQAP